MQLRRGPATVTGADRGSPRHWIVREGEPRARSQETIPFAHPAPSREGRWIDACVNARSTAELRGFERVVRSALETRRALSAAWSVAAVLTVALLSCTSARPPADVPAGRVVSLSPSFTELAFAVGAGDRLVGRTAWCDFPAAARDVPSVGDGLNPNVEAIAARRPDLVLVYPSAANQAALAQLAQLGVRTEQLRVDGLDDVVTVTRRLGALLGARDRAEQLADRFAAALDSARAAAPPEGRPTVLLLTWDQPPIVIGAGSFQHELVTLAGAINVFADLPQPSAQVSIETIVARDPELIVLLGAEATPAWTTRPEWQAVRAVRERRFVHVSGSAFARPSPRALDAVRQLRRAVAEARR